MRSRWSWLGLGMLLGLTVLSAWSAEPDPEEVKRRIEIYMRDDPAETKKSAPAPKPRLKPVVQPKPPKVDHDREAWQSAEKCGTAVCFEAYLEDYPNGRYMKMARARLKSEPESKPEPESRPAVVTERPAPAARRTNRRFTDNGNGTVTDNQSGLIWLKNANCFGEQDWSTAIASARRLSNGYCDLRDESGTGQWRLPSKEEWEALIDENARNPALPAGHPFTGVKPYYYWSSTAHDSTVAWFVGLGGGGGNWKDMSYYTYYVWPVRGGR